MSLLTYRNRSTHTRRRIDIIARFIHIHMQRTHRIEIYIQYDSHNSATCVSKNEIFGVAAIVGFAFVVVNAYSVALVKFRAHRIEYCISVDVIRTRKAQMHCYRRGSQPWNMEVRVHVVYFPMISFFSSSSSSVHVDDAVYPRDKIMFKHIDNYNNARAY